VEMNLFMGLPSERAKSASSLSSFRLLDLIPRDSLLLFYAA